MLVSGQFILNKAYKGRYAVGAFNINNMEVLQAIVEVALEMKSPVIIQTSEGAIDYAGMGYLIALVKEAAKTKIPIAFHLDHGKDLKKIKAAIQRGYTSVMIDGSHLSYENNIKVTRKVVAWAHKEKVSVEAELGAIQGVEDCVSVKEKEAYLTDPEQAREFVKLTNCDSLAIAIGTSHGAYKFKKQTRLDIERLKKIKSLVNKPLVLHGASSVPARLVRQAEQYGARLGQAKGNSLAEIKKAVQNGINKVNIDTDLRLAATLGIREILVKDKRQIDPRKYLGNAKIKIRRVVKEKIILLGSSGKI